MTKSVISFAWALALAVTAGCGHEIGDSCVISTDCDPNGERFCDSTSKEGYCTIQGCSFNTCPDEAVCVSFFTGGFTNKTCTQPSDCSLDEICAVDGMCVLQKSEQRNCMRKCDSDGDCRDGYECRNLELMMEHGGQPLLAPGQVIDESSPKFCAPAPP